VGKAIAKIRSLLDASSIGVMRIDGAGRLGGESFRPVISWTIISISVVVMFRFGTID
jgi:hypothetical protein